MSPPTAYSLVCPSLASELQQTCSSSCACSPVLPNVTTPVTVDYQQNVAIAFAMVTAAGLSTTIGAALVFCNRCVTRTNHGILGAALGFSSGVMLFVSFVEILQKSLGSFTECNCLWKTQSNDNAAYTAATLCFFGGVVIVYLLDFVVHCVAKHGHGHSHGPEALSDRGHSNFERRSDATDTPEDTKQAEEVKLNQKQRASHPAVDELLLEDEMSSGDEENKEAMKNPEGFLDRTLSRNMHDVPIPADGTVDEESLFDIERQMSRRMQEVESSEIREGNDATITVKSPRHMHYAEEHNGISSAKVETAAAPHGHGHTHGHHHDAKGVDDEEMKRKLNHMGLMTALAIGLHNFPEGLATFVASLADPQVGAALAVAIAFHNIPEGLCVSIPIYYATGSRTKAFWVAFFSGVTEIIGAALGYGFLMAIMGPAAYAVLFGLVAGMMVTIVVKELLPTAHRYDPHDRVVTISIFLGMLVMALSLVLFRI